MSEEQGKPFEVVADEALEARIVSWVLGEAFEFEAEELQRLCNERPELEVFRRRIVAVHGLAGEGLKKPETDWKLPAEKRQKVLSAIGWREREARRERSSRFAARRVLLAAAACLGLTAIVAALVFPLFFRASAWKAGSSEAAARMDGREVESYSVSRKAEAELLDVEDSIRGLAAELNGKRNEPAVEMEGRDSGLLASDVRRGGLGRDLSVIEGMTTRGAASEEVARLGKVQEEKRKARTVPRDLMMKEAGEAPATRPARPREEFHASPAPVPPPAAEPPVVGQDESGPRGAVSTGSMTSLATDLPTERIEGTPARVALPGGTGVETKPPPKPAAEPTPAPAEAPAIANGNMVFKDGDTLGVGGGSGGGIADAAKGGGKVPMLGDVPVAGAMFGSGAVQSGGEVDRYKNSGSRTNADFIKPADPASTPGIPAGEAKDVAGIVTGGTRSGDGAITRNSIDAVLNGPGRTAEAAPTEGGEDSTTAGREAGYWWRAREAAKPDSGVDRERGRAELLSQVDSAWETDDKDGERRAGEKASKDFDSRGSATAAESFLFARQKTESLETDAEVERTRGENQKSAVQQLREDMAGDDDFGSEINEKSGSRFESRSLDVGANFLHRFMGVDQDRDGAGEMDPFVDNSESGLSLSRRQSAGEMLLNYGLRLPEGSEVRFDAEHGKLLIKAPEDTVEDLQELVDSLPEPPSAGTAIDLMAEMSAAEEAFSTFSLHVSDASFRVAAAALARGERPDPAAVRPEEFYNAFDYGDPAPTAGEPVACAIEQCAHPLLPSRNLVRVGVRTAAAGRGAGQPLRLTVLLDNSGSMEREDRRAAVAAAMEQLASLLGPQDVVTVVGFARQPRLLADRVSGEGVAEQLKGLVEKTPAEGGTNLEQALELAGELAMRQFAGGAQNRIVLLTDGAANLGNADPEELAKRVEGLRQQGVSFDAAGFGTAGLNDRMLERLTRDGNGRYYVVDGPEDAGEQFAKKLAGAFRPAAENVKVQVRFNPARVGGYRLIGFEEHRLNKEDFRDDTVDAAEMASEEAGVAVYQVELLPDGEGEIGEVSVRFRDASKGKMVERSWTMPHDESAPGFDRAPASMQVAGLAVLAADALRDGPLAPLTDWSELAPVSNQVRAEFGGSEKVGQLLQMVERLR